MILLGALAVSVMLVYPQGLWGLIAERWTFTASPSSAAWRSTKPRGLDTPNTGRIPSTVGRDGALDDRPRERRGSMKTHRR